MVFSNKVVGWKMHQRGSHRVHYLFAASRPSLGFTTACGIHMEDYVHGNPPTNDGRCKSCIRATNLVRT